MNLRVFLVALLQLCNAYALHLHTAKPTGPQRNTTGLTDYLNSKLETGLVVRAYDKGITTPFVPATYWSNDIETPNSFFIYQQPIGVVKDETKNLAYWLPHIGYVSDPDLFEAHNLWGDYGKTMYGHDANSCDDNSDPVYDHYGRCTWLPSVGFDDVKHEHWECPGGLFPTINASKESFIKDVSKRGAGTYACRGCHFQQGGFFNNNNHVNKILADLDAVGSNCQCPCNDYASCYRFAIRDLRSTINNPALKKLKDAWVGYDKNICWVESPDALAGIQNGLYQTRNLQGMAETSYWGWNEIAVKSNIDSPEFWLTHMIFFPAWLTRRTNNGLDTDIRKYLGGLIQQLVSEQQIKPGKDQIGQRPGSDVVFVEEIRKISGHAYEKNFFCMQQDLGRFTICSLAQEDDPDYKGHCYIAETAKGCNE